MPVQQQRYNTYLLRMLSGYGWTLFTFFLGHIFLGIFLNWSIQCAAVSMNFKLICVPSQSVPQFISSRMTSHGVLPGFELHPPAGPKGILLPLFGAFVNVLCAGFLSLLIRVLVPYFWCGRLYCLVWVGCLRLGFLIALCLTLDYSWSRLQILNKNCCTPFFMGLLSHWIALYTNVKPANERRFFEKNTTWHLQATFYGSFSSA